MNKLIFLLTIILTCIISIAQAGNKTYGDFYGVTYVKNYDGDTITFDIPYLPPLIGENINIRVDGLDTPEIKGKCKKEKALAKEVRNYVTLLMLNAHQIDLLNTKRGKYFRIVADVMIDNESLTQILLDKGYAIEYDGDTKTKNWCAND